MKVSLLTPLPRERVLFTLRSTPLLPAGPGCYVLTNFQEDVLYVGLSVNLAERFKQHRESDEKCKPTTLGRAHWFYYLTSDNKAINAIERGWQNQFASVHGELPVLNSLNSPVH